jgi:hypothetical protein
VRSSRLVSWFVGCLGLASVPAQTFVVDAAGGVGVHYTSIVAAVAGVPDGSTLVVHAATYAPFDIVGKGLTILAEPGTSVSGGVLVLGTAANQPVVVRGVTATSTRVLSCLGPVHLVALGTSPTIASLQVSDSSQVLVDGGDFVSFLGPAARVTNCPAFVLVGSRAIAGIGHGLDVQASDVQVVDCELRGGVGVAPATAFGLHVSAGSRVRLLGATSVRAGTSQPASSGPQLAIGYFGQVRAAPSVQVVGAVGPNVAFQATNECALRVTGGVISMSATATLRGDPGAIAGLWLGLPAPASVLSGFASDGLWLAPSSAAPVAMGVLAGPLAVSVSVPTHAQLIGQSFGFQAVTWHAAASFTLSNPGWFPVR